MKAPDLRKEYPRSPHEDLGGYVLLPRIIDKCRATLAGMNGEYNYNCPLDHQFFDFTDIGAEDLKEQIASGKSDEEILKYVQDKGEKHSEAEILIWSFEQRHRGPVLADQKIYFERLRKKAAPNHPWISAWFNILDAEEGRIR